MFFSESEHKYYKNFIEEENKFISSTSIIHLYSNEFDNDYWSLYKAYEFLIYKEYVDNMFSIDDYLNNKPEEPKMYFKSFKSNYKIGDYKLFDYLKNFIDENRVKRISEYIKKQWTETNKKSLIKGTNLHVEKEEDFLEKDKIINPFTKKELKVIKPHTWIKPGVKQRIVDLRKLEEGFYPELILNYNNIVGQADKLYFEKINNSNQLGFYIDDWKTNSSINKNNKFQKMKAPINNLDDCNYNHYRIQLGIYSWILEQYGYKCLGSAITHCKLTEDNKWIYKKYNFKYIKPIIKLIINDLKSKNIYQEL